MGENETEQPTEPRSRRWIPWTVMGGIAVVAAAVAAALVVPGLLPADTAPPAASPPPPPTTTPPTEPACDSRLDAALPEPFDISATGELTRIEVDAFDADAVGPSSPWVDTERVDDGVLALRTSVDTPAGALTRLTVVEEASDRSRWASTFEGHAQVLGSPATTGVEDRLLVGHPDADGFRLVALDLTDGDVVASVVTATHPWGDVALRPAGDGRLPASQSQQAFFVRDFDTVTRLHAETLEPEWTVSGVPFDAARSEGGGFDIVVAGDVLFISGIAFDAETGEELGWSIDGTVVAGGGHALAMPVRFDSYDPFPLSATDLRTGEACWTLEVLEVVADGSDLWVVDAAREVQRIDPKTGEVLERRGTVPALSDADDGIRLLARDGIVATITSDPSFEQEPKAYAWTPDGAVELPAAPSFISNGQFVTHEAGRLHAHAAVDGSPLWTAEVRGQLGGAGLADAAADGPGRVSIAVVR